MRKACLAVLLAATALIAMASLAGVASAQETDVEVQVEPSTEPCNPCVVGMVGESQLINLISGLPLSICTDQYQASLYADGTGEVEWVGTADGTPACNSTVNCQTMSPHWPITVPIGELGGEREHFTMRMCLRRNGVEVECNVEVVIDRTEMIHQYALTADQVCVVGMTPLLRIEIDAITEGEGIELVHAED